MNLIEITLVLVILLKIFSSCHQEYVKLTANDGMVLYEANITKSSECQNRPVERRTEVSGIESGYQLLLYSEQDCKAAFLKYTKPGSVMSLKRDNDIITQIRKFELESWQAYVPRLPTNKLRVQIFNNEHKENTLRIFEDVCGCTNIKNHTYMKFDTFNAQGACLVLYRSRSCFYDGHKSSTYGTGSNYPLRICDPLRPTECGKVASFKPCDPRNHCSSLQGIYKIFTLVRHVPEETQFYEIDHRLRNKNVKLSEGVPWFHNYSRLSNFMLSFAYDKNFETAAAALNMASRDYVPVPVEHRYNFFGSDLPMYETNKYTKESLRIELLNGKVTGSYFSERNWKWCIGKPVEITSNDFVVVNFLFNIAKHIVAYYAIEIYVTGLYGINGIYGDREVMSSSDIKAYINMNNHLNLTVVSVVNNNTVVVKNEFQSVGDIPFATLYNISQPKSNVPH